MIRSPKPAVYAVLLSIVLVGCATVGFNRVIQIAVAQKILVEACTVEAIRLYQAKHISQGDMERIKESYLRWAEHSEIATRDVITWRTVGNAENERRLRRSMDRLRDSTDQLMDLLSQHVNVDGVTQKLYYQGILQ